MKLLILPDQTGFIPGRKTAINIRRLLALMNEIVCDRETALVLAVDIENAFNSLEWQFLYAVIKHMNLGNRFIAWTAQTYTNTSAS